MGRAPYDVMYHWRDDADGRRTPWQFTPSHENVQRLLELFVEHRPHCNTGRTGHDPSCSCPRVIGPEFFKWLVNHGYMTKCELCKGAGKVHVHVSVEHALKQESVKL